LNQDFDQIKIMRNKIFAAIILVIITGPCLAVELGCTGQTLGQFFINTETGDLTRGGQTQKVGVIADDAHYGFTGVQWSCVDHGCSVIKEFNISISRSTGQVTIDGEAWNGSYGPPLIGVCQPVGKPKF
jgi:hypothetical protein